MDAQGSKEAWGYIFILKIKAPKMCHEVADRAMQMHGGMWVTEDSSIRHIWMMSRACQIADGPDEVHMSLLARRPIRYSY
jgi:acyl-CoA dehydrogenase